MSNPATRQQWILDELKFNPMLSFVECFSKYFEKFSKSEVTFSKDWKVSSETHKDYQIKANKAKEEASIQIEVESLKNGIKTKSERVLILQNEVDASLEELNDPEATLNVFQKVSLRKVIKELQSEISKIQGDYAPEKKEHEIKSINLSRIEFVNKTSK